MPSSYVKLPKMTKKAILPKNKSSKVSLATSKKNKNKEFHLFTINYVYS